MRKKFLIIISVGLILCTGIYAVLFSTNFLFPKQMSDTEIQDIFRPEFIRDLKTVYSFGNFKNHVSYHEINGQIRCRVWKLNEYSSLPLFVKSVTSDSIQITNYIKNIYGKNPSLNDYIKQFHSFSKQPELKIDKYSEIISYNKTDNHLDCFGRFISFGLYDNKKECELKLQFDKLTLARLMFIKKKDNFYLVVFYGINGYEIDKNIEIIKTI